MFDDFTPTPHAEASSALAAIDLGSNSFRLEIGRVVHGQYLLDHAVKEMVSLGAGLDEQGLLSEEAIERGLCCLRIFATELTRLQPARVRVVATQTLREARNRDEFVRRAEAVLGLPVEVISGQEEARLIYAGVSFLHPTARRRLVIDIGGRSTEMIVGQGRTPTTIASFRIGCASLSKQFFPDGRITAAGFRSAQLAVDEQLSQSLAPFAAAHWDEAMGASGTANAVSSVLKANGITDGVLTPKALRWLIDRCIEAGKVKRLDLPGLKPQRRALLPGGLAILYTLAAHCAIPRLRSAKGALRQGVIVDLHEASQAARPLTPNMAVMRADRWADFTSSASVPLNA